MWKIAARFITAAASVSHLLVRDDGLDSETCATGLHLIVARGSGEDKGLGRIGVVARNVTLVIPGSTIEAIDYPATFTNYTTSEETGAMDFESRVLTYHEKCPDTKIALLGYSQGAQALMDSLCGSSFEDEGDDYTANPAVIELFTERVGEFAPVHLDLRLDIEPRH